MFHDHDEPISVLRMDHLPRLSEPDAALFALRLTGPRPGAIAEKTRRAPRRLQE